MMVQLQQEARKRKAKSHREKNVIINKLLGTIIYIYISTVVGVLSKSISPNSKILHISSQTTSHLKGHTLPTTTDVV
jgi:hypothetical protein